MQRDGSSVKRLRPCAVHHQAKPGGSASIDCSAERMVFPLTGGDGQGGPAGRRLRRIQHKSLYERKLIARLGSSGKKVGIGVAVQPAQGQVIRIDSHGGHGLPALSVHIDHSIADSLV